MSFDAPHCSIDATVPDKSLPRLGSVTLVRVTALHKWPLDPDKVSAEMAKYDFSESLRSLITLAHDSAWIVVIEHDGPESEVDLDQITYAMPGISLDDIQNRQVPWGEQTILATSTLTRIAFFLHHVAPTGRFFYGETELPLPTATPIPPDLEHLEYESP